MSHRSGILCFGMIGALSLLVAGCRTPNGVLFVEGTKFALDVSASTSETQPMVFSVGYKRDIASIVPKKCVPNCETTDAEGNPVQPDEEALSMISTFSIRVEQDTPGWPNDLVIRNNFASGRAAEALAAPPVVTPAQSARSSTPADPAATPPAGDDRIRNLLRGVR